MARIACFEDIEAWKAARELAGAIYRVSGEGAFARDYGLRDQIRRAAVSALSNIAEGFERDSDREFRRFLVIAKGSAGEVRAQLYVALDAGLISRAQFDDLTQQARALSRMISGFVKYLAAGETHPPTKTF